jgi:class 3 adenylate cyclase
MTSPAVRYARSGDLHIAYTVAGGGDTDVVFVPGLVSHVELHDAVPFNAHLLRRLRRVARLIVFDKRGTGLSDRDTGMPTLEERMDDVRAVMDAAGSDRAILCGTSEGGPLCLLFAATYPERTRGLVLLGCYARLTTGPDQSWGLPSEAVDGLIEMVRDRWGTGSTLAYIFPSAVTADPSLLEVLARFERNSATPNAVAELMRMNCAIDARSILPSVTAPSLVVHHTDDGLVPVECGRELAARLPNATFREFESSDHLPLRAESPVLDLVEEFITGQPAAAPVERVLSTVMFTDIVDSTPTAVRLGDQAWRELLDRHDAAVRDELTRHRGREVKSTGDGFVAVFDGPARAVRCAVAIGSRVRPMGLAVRAGVHVGEVELRGDDIGGIAVHVAARIAGTAGADEVLVSRTVTDLVAGSGLDFVDRGEHTLKGVPRPWPLYAVAP